MRVLRSRVFEEDGGWKKFRVRTLGRPRRRLVASSSVPRQNVGVEKGRGANFIMGEIGACAARVCVQENENGQKPFEA